MWCFFKSGLKVLLVLQIAAALYAVYVKNGFQLWTESPSKIQELGESLVQKSTSFYDQLASTEPTDITIQSVLHPYMKHESEIDRLSQGIKKYYKSSNDALLQASEQFGAKYAELQKSKFLRKDVYQVLKKLQQKIQDKSEEVIELTEEETRFLNDKITQFEQSGLGSAQHKVTKFFEGFPWIL